MSTPQQSSAAMSPEERRALLARLLREKAKSQRTPFPLSYGQKALYFTHQLAPESGAYNVSFAASVRSPIDEQALRRAYQALIDRHAALRTTFAHTETGTVQIVAGAADLEMAAVDASGLDDQALKQLVEETQQRPFDLENGPLLRVDLFTRSANEHVLLMTVHHIVFDGWSMGVLLDELATLYSAEANGTAANLPPVARQYSDFVAWQQALLSGSEGERLWRFWSQQLSGTLPILDLPIDHPRPAFQRFSGDVYSFGLENKLAGQLRSLAKTEHATLYSLILAAFYVLLHRLTGQDDLIIGSPMAGRGQPEFQQTIGYLVSPLPLRVTMTGEQSFRSTLAVVRQTVHAALAHENYPFARMVEQLQPKREPGRTPIMEVIFTHQKVQILGKFAESMVSRDRAGAVADTALRLEPYLINQENGQFDLSFLLIEADEELSVSLKYNRDLFDLTTVKRMAGYFQTLLEGIVANPDCAVGRLPLLPLIEQQQLATWNSTARPYQLDVCLHDLIAAQAHRTPDAPALRFERQTMSYRTLNSRANQLAHHLRSLGVGPDVLVGVCAERSFELVIALLATMKAGGAYVPLDPGYPEERLQFMIGDAAPAVLLTVTSLSERLPIATSNSDPALFCLDSDWPMLTDYPQTDPTHEAAAGNLAYMIYTSGSTGRPKGALNEHRGIVNRLLWMQEHYQLAESDRVLQKTPFSFDVSVWEFFWPLLAGATLVVARPDGHKDPAYLVELIATEAVTTVHFVPSMLQVFLEHQDAHQCTSLQRVICSGEALPFALSERFFRELPQTELHNLYGPTEAAVDVTYWMCRPGDPRGIVPIGFPVANTQMYILDRYLQPVPPGVAGELHIGGTQVGRGYHKRAELTVERFISDPFASDNALHCDRPPRLYKTGDLARYLSDGSIEYLGRMDFQVKIRGFRIELGEIEAALIQHPAVREAVVVAREDHRGSLRLLAYVTPSETQPQAGALRMHLRATLPDYMIPAAFIVLEQLPLSPNGKLDRRALPSPEPARTRSDENYVPPSTPTEQAVAAVWCDLLGLSRVSAYDNFFDLGGHSLIAVEAMARLEQELGPRLNPALIRAQTLGQLAASYDEILRQSKAEAASAPPPQPVEQQGLTGRIFGALRRAIPTGEKSR